MKIVASMTLHFKNRAIGTFVLREGSMSIGRSPKCDIVIDSLAINPVHACIHTTGTVHVLEDLGSRTGTRVNGARVERHRLHHGDCLEIGKHMLTFESKKRTGTDTVQPASPAASDESTAEIGFLHVVRGTRYQRSIALDQPLITIGRPHQQMALVAHRNNGYFLSHLEGQQSPVVNEVTIGDRSWPLADGNLIQIGDVTLRFKLKRRPRVTGEPDNKTR